MLSVSRSAPNTEAPQIEGCEWSTLVDDGTGVGANMTLAAQWFERAVETKPMKDAQFMLAICYQKATFIMCLESGIAWSSSPATWFAAHVHVAVLT